MKYTGPERRKEAKRKHLLYSALVVWIVIFSVFTIIVWRDQRHTINDLNHAIKDLKETKASIKSLKETNCGLVSFLEKAKQARANTAKHEDGSKKEIDLHAVAGYQNLIDQFRPIGPCPKEGG